MYKIVRMYFNHPSRVIKRGLTLEEAQEHCRDPETSSKTCTSSAGKARTRRMGAWFDGYEEERRKVGRRQKPFEQHLAEHDEKDPDCRFCAWR